MIRRAAAALAAIALLAILAAPVAAGGWAEIKPDAASTTEPPVEGQPTDVGFTVLQHGETPADWVSAMVTVRDIQTGESFDVKATPTGGGGHFTATFTVPHSGYWSWSVSFPDLAYDPNAVAMVVAARDGSVPVFDPNLAVIAIERVRGDAQLAVREAMGSELERIDRAAALQASINERVQEQLATITEERDALAAQLAETGGVGLTPSLLAGVLLLAVLAGASAGFVMTWLGSRSGPRQVEVSLAPAPASRGADPA